MVHHAIALVGAPDLVFEAALDLMRMPDFDPTRVVVLHLSPGVEVPRVDQVFGVGINVPGGVRLRTGFADEALAKIFQSPAEPLEPAGVSRNGPNRIEFSAPSDGWLVASEKLALYPGWSATIRRAPLSLFRADGVLTAMQVRAGQVVRAAYEPPRFRIGLALFGTMVLAIVAADRRSRRRARRPDARAQ
jgi:hypothetical protein